MGKKRKASRREDGPKGPKELDRADARLGPINTFEDVADSGDEFWMKRDMISLDDGPDRKKRKHWEQQDEPLDESEEEVLGNDDSQDDSDDYASDLERIQANLKRKTKTRILEPDEGIPGGDEESDDDEEEGWYGATRDEYYNADNIETEEAALEEEAEALRLQQKKLSKMSEADFVFDEDEWAQPTGDRPDKTVVTEVLNDVEISDDMTPEQQYQLLTRRYPEFDSLISDFEELQPRLAELQKEAEGKPPKSLEVIKYWTLGCYVAALASYLAILTSPARDEAGVFQALDPEELREHEVMETLFNCQEQWMKVKNLKRKKPVPSPPAPPLSIPDNPSVTAKANDDGGASQSPTRPERKKKVTSELREQQKAAQKAKQAQAVQDSIADLSALLKKPKKAKKPTPAAAQRNAAADDDGSDIGEEEVMDAKYAADKAARKKSLRFYTAQITQKSNKRADAGKQAGGDMDIPYRERLKDRQARLTAQAQKRGSKAGPGADLDDNSSSDGEGRGKNSDEEYYDMITGLAQRKKAEKAARFEAYAAASRNDRVVEQEELGEDGKRKISYAIEKNKGLAPNRKKTDRNPRVKKRKKYAEKQKKWRTMRPTYKGAPEGGYQGELSGIKKGLVKVTKLS